MTTEQLEILQKGIISSQSARGILLARQKPFLFQSVEHEFTDKFKSEGWEIHKEYKKKCTLKKPKSWDVAFEDEVWFLMASMGFHLLNKDRNFRIPYSDDFSIKQQIDVFAADDETILVIECKATDGEPKKGNFKETIEAIGGRKEGIIKTIRKMFPNAKQKIRFILATKNYFLSPQDSERLTNFGILHFDEEIIKYYQDLTKHLGLSSRYQLLGNLFEGSTIPELDNQIPAIQGKMGRHTYYSFSIEPEKLLKIGYVLHRNKANKKLMPTYQRLIKKSRLKSVQEFVEEGGIFPNSIIINIQSSGKNIRFDQASPQVKDSISKIGILHLPKNYRSAFIIDGQHRLYGYANSEYKNTNSIPVVAFIDLERKEQVNLFMQINENQKAVPKNLRNTLNADLLWGSDFLSDRIKALKLHISQDLGEEKSSPLYDRIIIGENPKTSTRCITIDAIKIGLDRSNFFGTFTKNSIKTDGTFFKGDNDETYKILYPFIEGCFSYIKEKLPIEWSNGEGNGETVAINIGITALIHIFSDIVDHIVKSDSVNPKSEKTEKVIKDCIFYMDPIINFMKKLTVEQKLELRKSYGGSGPTKYWRILQKAINDARPEFIPGDFEIYSRNEAKRFNTQSIEMIREIETSLKNDFKNRLEKHYGTAWFKKGVPPKVQDDAILLAAQKNRETDSTKDEVSNWDCLNIIDYRSIATYGKNWSELFEKSYTKPGEEKIRGGKDEKTKWMQKLERIRNQNFHSYSVKEEEFDFLKELYAWLIEKNIENDLE